MWWRRINIVPVIMIETLEMTAVYSVSMRKRQQIRRPTLLQCNIILVKASQNTDNIDASDNITVFELISRCFFWAGYDFWRVIRTD